MLHRQLTLGLTLGALGAAAASAQTPVPFPLTPDAEIPAPGIQSLVPSPAAIAALADFDSVRLTGVSNAAGEPYDLILTQVDLDRLKFGFQVDGRPANDLLEGLDLSVWIGSIAGEPGSEAVLSFSNRGTRGWISDGEQLTHLLPQAENNESWENARTWVASEERLRQLGVQNQFRCDTAGVEGELVPEHEPTRGQTAEAGAGCTLLEAKIAIECDYQYHQIFSNDLAAQTAHVTSLLAAASARYEDQIDTVLTYPYVQFNTNVNDGWSTPESGGGSIDMLNEFVGAWTGNIPGGANMGHFLSGAGLGGGVAYLSGICDASQTFAFAVSGNLDGQLQFPITVNPFNWEFIVFTHETGHSFSSPHTHDYSPQIDNCAGGSCITNGTVMSYCHLCPGGMNNMTTLFHPTVVDVMKNGAGSCLPLYVGATVQQLTLVAPDTATAVSAEVVGTLIGTPSLEVSLDNGASFASVPMTLVAGNTYTADLPPAPCGAAASYFVSFTEQTCGFTQTDVIEVEIGNETVLIADDFEAPGGWTVGAPGDDATTGIWTRVNPVGTSAQSEDDHTVGGSLAFITGQHNGGGAGDNDVDGGRTTLTSPTLDLSSGDARIGYWRWFSNDAGSNPGAESLIVDISNDGGNSWIEVEEVGPSFQASGGWFFHEFTVSDFVAPTANVELRFVASDDFGSIVEAAIDDFAVRRVDCIECADDLGFGSGNLTLELCGDALLTGGTADLVMNNVVPFNPAWFLVSNQFNPTPLVGGTVVTVPLGSLFLVTADGAGTASLLGIPGGGGPATRYVQGLGLDLSLPELAELSNALQVEFLP